MRNIKPLIQIDAEEITCGKCHFQTQTKFEFCKCDLFGGLVVLMKNELGQNLRDAECIRMDLENTES